MAGDWIKVRVRLVDDPAVLAISTRFGILPETVVGYLIRAWSWATDQLVDGHAPGVTLAHFDRVVGLPNFGESLVEVGWLKATKSGLIFPKWDRHLSQGSKARALATNRKSQERHGASVTKPRPEKRREEDRREQERSPPAPDGPVPEIAPSLLTGDERIAVRQGLIRIGVESGAAQQVSLHPNLTLAMVKGTLAAVKKDKTIKSQPAVVLTRLRRELEMSE
jgi:hypothetical protein